MFILFTPPADILDAQIDALIQQGFTMRTEGATLVVSGDEAALRALHATLTEQHPEFGSTLAGEESPAAPPEVAVEVAAEAVPADTLAVESGGPDETPEAPWTSCTVTLWDQDDAALVLSGQALIRALTGHVRYRTPSTEWTADGRWAINFDAPPDERIGAILGAAVQEVAPIGWSLTSSTDGWAAGSEKPKKKR